MMDIDKIKQKILDLAIRGKLVPQDPNDEPASVLVEKIKAEKEKMVKEGKIKPSKDESYIYKDSDNCYYEKKGNEVRDITSEIPFKIPNSWRWVRLKNIGTIVGGGTPDTSNQNYWNGDIVWITPANMSKLKSLFVENSDRKITSLGLVKSSAQLLPANSIIMSSRAPIGYLAINKTPACTSQGCKSLIPLYEGGCEYIVCALKARMSSIKSNGSGNTFSEISGKDFSNIIIPLPPSKEQKRIVEEYNAFVDKIDSIVCEYHQIVAISNHIKLKILDHFFGENSSYKSYYPNYHIKDLCQLGKGKSEQKGVYPYLEAKVIRGIKQPKYIKSGCFIEKGTKVILVDGENSGEVMIAPFDGYLGSTFRILTTKNNISSEYLMWFIEHYKKTLKSNKTGSAVPHLNKNIFYNLTIALPPLKIQEKYSCEITKCFTLFKAILS